MEDLHRVLFDDDPAIGRKVWLLFDPKGDIRGAYVEQDVDAVIAYNREAEKATHGVRFGDYARVASVPLTFLEKTGLGEAIDHGDRRFMSKILNDADYSGFRTSRGKV